MNIHNQAVRAAYASHESVQQEMGQIYSDWPVPDTLRERFTGQDADTTDRISRRLVQMDKALGGFGAKRDLEDHLFRRLSWDRVQVVPWLNSVMMLSGSRILEIGCGSGSSTASLAEQGAHVVAVDIQAHALEMARARCEIMGIQGAEFCHANATEIGQVFRGQSYDMIIFFASLEHLLIEERLKALATAWDMLPSNGLLVVVDTPNRLWFFDDHTAFLPFFHWLPDDLALMYARQFCRREPLLDQFRGEGAMLNFQRAGRGVSFHEFDLAIGPVGSLTVVSSKEEFLRASHRSHFSRWQASAQREFVEFIRSQLPNLHGGFFERYLEIAIRK